MDAAASDPDVFSGDVSDVRVGKQRHSGLRTQFRDRTRFGRLHGAGHRIAAAGPSDLDQGNDLGSHLRARRRRSCSALPSPGPSQSRPYCPSWRWRLGRPAPQLYRTLSLRSQSAAGGRNDGGHRNAAGAAGAQNARTLPGAGHPGGGRSVPDAAGSGALRCSRPASCAGRGSPRAARRYEFHCCRRRGPVRRVDPLAREQPARTRLGDDP